MRATNKSNVGVAESIKGIKQACGPETRSTMTKHQTHTETGRATSTGKSVLFFCGPHYGSHAILRTLVTLVEGSHSDDVNAGSEQ